MDTKEREIPEELFQKDFGGNEIKSLLKEKSRKQSSERALLLLVGMYAVPAIFFVIVIAFLVTTHMAMNGPVKI